MNSLNRNEVLELTDGGIKLFQLLLPDLKMAGDRNTGNIDSIISNGKKCLSVWKWNGKYMFKDHFSKVSGDIFTFIAIINKLVLPKDFRSVLEIIESMINDKVSSIPEDNLERYINLEDECILTLVTEEDSKPYIENIFKNFHPYIENPINYRIHMVQSFELCIGTNFIDFKYDFSKPNDVFYALEIKKGEYYILYNPKSTICYSWGNTPEFYLPGLEQLFQSAHLKNIYFRENIVLTNKIEGLLFLQDIGVPCLALIENEIALPAYIENEILPHFSHKYLMMEYSKAGSQQLKNFISQDFENIITGEFHLNKFLMKGQLAIDKVYDYLKFNNCFEYLGFANSIKRVA